MPTDDEQLYNLDQSFFSALVRDQKIEPALEAGIAAKHFSGGYEKIWAYVVEYYNTDKYKGALPTRRTLESKFRAKANWEGFSYVEVEESLVFLCDKLIERHNYQQLVSVLGSVTRYLKPGEENVEQARQALLEGAVNIARDKSKATFIDLSSNAEDRIQEYYNRKNGIGVYGTPSGFEPLDRRTLGFQDEDYVYVMAKSGVGKSWFLLKMADTANRIANKRVLVLPLEMRAKAVAMRFDALRHKLPYQAFRRGKLTPEIERRWIEQLRREKDNPSFIVASDELFENEPITPLSLRAKVRELNVGAVFIDGVYMMRPDERLSGWEAHVSIAENLKKLFRTEQIFGVLTNQIKNDVSAEDARKEDQANGSYHRWADIQIKIHQTADQKIDKQMLMWIMKIREEEEPAHPIRIDWAFDEMNLGEGDYDPDSKEESQTQKVVY